MAEAEWSAALGEQKTLRALAYAAGCVAGASSGTAVLTPSKARPQLAEVGNLLGMAGEDRKHGFASPTRTEVLCDLSH